MKVAIFSDIHLGLKADASMWDEVAEKWTDWFVMENKSRGIDTIIFLGDFFHTRKSISVYTLHQTVGILKKLKDFNVHMIIGNHDLFYLNDSNVSAVNLFNEFPNITVHKELDVINLGGRSCVFAGWGLDPLTVDGKHDVLFTHAEINTFRLNSAGTEFTNGVEAAPLVRKYKLIYSGHFHAKQERIYPNGKIRYVGSTFQTTFSDVGDEKGFDILDLDTLEWEPLINKDTPRFKVITTSRFRVGDYEEDFSNCIVKLVVDEHITLKEVEDIKSQILMRGVLEMRETEWLTKDILEQREDRHIDIFDLSNVIVEFVDTLDIKEKEKTKEYLLKLFQEKSAEG